MLQRDSSPDDAGLRPAPAAPHRRGHRRHGARPGDAGVLARDAGGRRPHRRGGGDDARRDRRRPRPGQLPHRLRRRRRPAQPAQEQRPPGGGAAGGRGEGRLHPAGRAGAVDAAGRRGPAPAGAGRHGPLRRGAGRGRGAAAADGGAARGERGRGGGQPLERAREPCWTPAARPPWASSAGRRRWRSTPRSCRPSRRAAPASWRWPAPASTTTAPCCAWAAPPTPAPCSWAAGPSSRPNGIFVGLGKVYSALADLEDKTGGRAQAVRWEEVALGYNYQAGDPEDCAISHNNLANYLERQGAAPALVLAHRLAAAVIRYQTRSGALPPLCATWPTPTCRPRRRPSPPWSRQVEADRGRALRRASSSACPAPRPTATPPSPPCGSW